MFSIHQFICHNHIRNWGNIASHSLNPTRISQAFHDQHHTVMQHNKADTTIKFHEVVGIWVLSNTGDCRERDVLDVTAFKFYW
jgi:hypothetical protein